MKRVLLVVVLTLLIAAVAPIFVGSTPLDGRAANKAGPPSLSIYDTGLPDFSIGLNSSSLTLDLGSEAFVRVTVTGVNGYNGTIGMSVSISTNPPVTTAEGITAKLNPNVFTLSPQQPNGSAVLAFLTYDPVLHTNPSLGTYTVTVFGTALPLVRRAELGLTIQSSTPLPQAIPLLLFELGYRGLPSPGGTLRLESNFTDIGRFRVLVTWLNFRVDFGSFNQTTGLPLYLVPGQKENLSMNATIPSGVAIGDHEFSATVRWEYSISNDTNVWLPGDPIVLNGKVSVSRGTPNLFGSFAALASSAFRLISENRGSVLSGLLVYAGVVTLAVGLVIRDDRRKQARLSLT